MAWWVQDGVIVAKKDFNAPKHSELEVPNLMVIKAMQSLKSRGYVHEQFAWRHFYWSLTNEGIEYIRYVAQSCTVGRHVWWCGGVVLDAPDCGCWCVTRGKGKCDNEIRVCVCVRAWFERQ